MKSRHEISELRATFTVSSLLMYSQLTSLIDIDFVLYVNLQIAQKLFRRFIMPVRSVTKE